MKKITNQEVRSTKHRDVQISPRRVAARQEAVVRNIGIKPKKKEPRTQI
jgi:hypothetical protein